MFACGDEDRQSTRQTTWNSHHVLSSMNRICRAHVLFSFFAEFIIQFCKLSVLFVEKLHFLEKWVIVYFIVRDTTVLLHLFSLYQRWCFLNNVLSRRQRIKMVRFFVVELSTKISMINRLKRMIYFVWHWRVWHSKPG